MKQTLRSGGLVCEKYVVLVSDRSGTSNQPGLMAFEFSDQGPCPERVVQAVHCLHAELAQSMKNEPHVPCWNVPLRQVPRDCVREALTQFVGDIARRGMRVDLRGSKKVTEIDAVTVHAAGYSF